MNLIIKGKPVSVNASYRTRSRVRGAKNIYLDPSVVAYKDAVRWQAKVQWKKPILTEDLEITFKYYFIDNRMDHLNCNKAIADSLEGIVYKNDRQIKISHHYSHLDSKNPRIELIIKIINK